MESYHSNVQTWVVSSFSNNLKNLTIAGVQFAENAYGMDVYEGYQLWYQETRAYCKHYITELHDKRMSKSLYPCNVLIIYTNSIEELYIHIRLIFPVPHPKNVCPFPEGSEVDQTRPLALGSS